MDAFGSTCPLRFVGLCVIPMLEPALSTRLFQE